MPRKKRFPTLEIPVQFPHRGKSDLTFLIRCNFRSGKSNSPKRESFVPDSPLRFSFFHARTKNNRVRFPFRGKTDLPITFSIPFSIPNSLLREFSANSSCNFRAEEKAIVRRRTIFLCNFCPEEKSIFPL